MFFPISSTILHNFIREKNDKLRYCFYYKCICSCIQLVLLFPCLLFLFSPQPCAGSACLSIPRILGKALISLGEVHHSRSCQEAEGPARGNCPTRREQCREGLLGMPLHPLLGVQTRDKAPGDSRCPQAVSAPQVPCPGHRHVWDRAGLQPRGVRHAARLPHQLGLLEPAARPVHDHVP